MKTLLLRLLLAIGTILAPTKGMCLAALFLVFADLVTGVLVARKQKQPISSAGFKRSVVKISVYLSAIVLSFITQTYLLENTLPIMNIITSFIGITELLSILENINILSEQDLLKVIIDKLSLQSKDRE